MEMIEGKTLFISAALSLIFTAGATDTGLFAAVKISAEEIDDGDSVVIRSPQANALIGNAPAANSVVGGDPARIIKKHIHRQSVADVCVFSLRCAFR